LLRALPLVLASALAIGCPARARAECFAITDPLYVALDPAVYRNGTQALNAVNARIAAWGKSASPGSPRELAALYAVQADAYGILELDGQARAAAAKGLALVHGATDPLRLEMLATQALNTYDQPGMRPAAGIIEAARAAQAHRSRSQLCLEAALGVLEMRQGQIGAALQHLTDVYRVSDRPSLTAVQVEAAWPLGVLMRQIGDFDASLSLNAKKMDWDAAHDDTLALSTSTYLQGETLDAMHNFQGAITTFQQARTLSQSVGDLEGAAFENMKICEAEIALGHLAPARQHCASAEPLFAASGITDALKHTQSLLARIDLLEGHPERALKILDGVLDHGGTDMAATEIGPAYQDRAYANTALHHYQMAIADLEQYVRRQGDENLARRVKLQEAIDSRAAIEREDERNDLLRRELQLSRERAQRQTEQLRWIAAACIGGLVMTLLLSYILSANLRHRRQLIRLAREDSLTGLPNRGRTVELAAAALRAAVDRQRPLTIAILDLDHFKAVNDRYGHAAGDLVLKEVARVSRGSLRAGDVLGRWGGEEFLLILPDTTLDMALAGVERLRALALGIRVPEADARMRVTFSAGLATTADGARSLDEIIARADAALYEAKNDGRDLVRIDRESYQTASTGVRRALDLR
jgi:diguanylate cyclase (GGDEF)-like protein